MNHSDLLHVLEALEDAEAEFEELIIEKEWYVTAVTDKLLSAKQLIKEELALCRPAQPKLYQNHN